MRRSQRQPQSAQRVRPRDPRPARRHPGTRTRILEAAARLFHEQGFSATGLSTILREADVRSGSLYHFFASKENLLEAVLDWYLEQLDPALLARARAATPDPLERVFALLDLYLHGMTITGCTMGCPIGNLALEVGDSHATVRRKIEQNFLNWSGAVAAWLRQAADRFPAGTDFDELGRFVLVVMEGGIMQARARKSVSPFAGAVRTLRDYFDRLMAARTATGPASQSRANKQSPKSNQTRRRRRQ